MNIYFFVPFIVLFLTFITVSDKELFKSLFYTISFIIALWINIPCVLSASDFVGDATKLMYLPIKLSKDLGIVYIVLANFILCAMIHFETQFLNNDLFTKKEIKKMYDKFVADANELYIIGKDIDFLGKDGYEVQNERIKRLGIHAQLLCEETNDKELGELYKSFCEKGVGIKCYSESDNITNLKGQIKIDQSGNKRAMFMSKQAKKYKRVYIDNQFLIAAILEKYLDVYEKASNP